VPTTGRSARLGYRPALDGIRAASIAAVLLYHGGFLSGGWLGVDIFFTLSGFLITSLLLQEWARAGRIMLRDFYGRRARRLLPALFLAIALVGVEYVADPSLDTGLPYPVAAFSVIFYSGNWLEALLHRTDVLGLLDHTWSLAIEEQFYLVWPLALFFCLRRHLAARSLFVLALSLAVTSAVLRAALWHLGVSGVYYRTDARADGLLIGCAAAALWSTARARELMHRWTGLPVAIFGVAVVAVAALRLGTNSPSTYDGALFLVVLAAAVVILHTLAHDGSVLTRGLKTRPAVWIGARSYGIYLYHIPIFKAVDVTAIKNVARGWPAVATETALTVAVAAASYRWAEAPFLQRRRLRGAPPHVQRARTGVPGPPSPLNAPRVTATASRRVCTPSARIRRRT